jgi:hypothetical protein
MSLTADPPRASSAAQCARCGAPLAGDQEWCLECGQARTTLERPPDWRIAALIVAGVIALVAAGTAFALVRVSQNADQSAASQVAAASADRAPAATTPAPAVTPTTSATTPTAAATTPAATTPATTPATAPAPVTAGTTAHLLTWPAGLGGWTVVLASSRSQSAAQATATTLAGSVRNLGVLDSSAHPSMAPGYWVVFAGRYPTQEQAQAAAAALQTQGSAAAHARMVEPPGGN